MWPLEGQFSVLGIDLSPRRMTLGAASSWRTVLTSNWSCSWLGDTKSMSKDSFRMCGKENFPSLGWLKGLKLCMVTSSPRENQSELSQPRGNLGEGNGTPLQYSCLEYPMDGGAWWAAVHGVTKSRTWLNNFTFTFHFHALEKEMATHSSILAWRIPGTGEPGGLLSMGSHRVGHNWSDLAAAVAAAEEIWAKRCRGFESRWCY